MEHFTDLCKDSSIKTLYWGILVVAVIYLLWCYMGENLSNAPTTVYSSGQRATRMLARSSFTMPGQGDYETEAVDQMRPHEIQNIESPFVQNEGLTSMREAPNFWEVSDDLGAYQRRGGSTEAESARDKASRKAAEAARDAGKAARDAERADRKLREGMHPGVHNDGLLSGQLINVDADVNFDDDDLALNAWK